ncbi:DedA family protein [Anaplasma bovis]|uniref:DedA family protein n=1 Tax=Anaplasma bovis TaxID=186733 RepID=UPI002FF2DDFC
MSTYSVLEVYLLLLTDSFVASLILPLNKVSVFTAMCYFGTYSLPLSVVTASLGASLGSYINWFLGKLVYQARIEYQSRARGLTQTGKNFSNKFVAALLILAISSSWIYLVGAIINVLCGYFRLRAMHVYFAALLSYFSYFLYTAITCS